MMEDFNSRSWIRSISSSNDPSRNLVGLASLVVVCGNGNFLSRTARANIQGAMPLSAATRLADSVIIVCPDL